MSRARPSSSRTSGDSVPRGEAARLAPPPGVPHSRGRCDFQCRKHAPEGLYAAERILARVGPPPPMLIRPSVIRSDDTEANSVDQTDACKEGEPDIPLRDSTRCAMAAVAGTGRPGSCRRTVARGSSGDAAGTSMPYSCATSLATGSANNCCLMMCLSVRRAFRRVSAETVSQSRLNGDGVIGGPDKTPARRSRNVRRGFGDKQLPGRIPVRPGLLSRPNRPD